MALTPAQRQALHSSASVEWATPPDLLAEIRAFLGEIDLDPCALPPNGDAHPLGLAGRPNGLTLSWSGRRVFCNPPYSRAIGQWIRKALGEPVRECVLLVPARTDARWFQGLYAHPICFIQGRLRFGGSRTGAPFPSALVYRGPREQIFAGAFARRGVVVRAVHPTTPTGLAEGVNASHSLWSSLDYPLDCPLDYPLDCPADDSLAEQEPEEPSRAELLATAPF